MGQVQKHHAAVLLQRDGVLHRQRLQLRALNLFSEDASERLLAVGVGQIDFGQHVDHFRAQNRAVGDILRVSGQAQKQRMRALRADERKPAVHQRRRGVLPEHLGQREFAVVVLWQDHLTVVVQQHDVHADFRKQA